MRSAPTKAPGGICDRVRRAAWPLAGSNVQMVVVLHETPIRLDSSRPTEKRLSAGLHILLQVWAATAPGRTISGTFLAEERNWHKSRRAGHAA